LTEGSDNWDDFIKIDVPDTKNTLVVAFSYYFDFVKDLSVTDIFATPNSLGCIDMKVIETLA